MTRVPPWLLIVVACAAQFLVVLDISIVNVALPAMRADLGFGESGLEWVVNAYTLTFAGLLLLGGRVADVLGTSRMFAVGVGVFAAASLAGGLAGSPGMLIAARAVQGVGAAILSPTTLAVLLIKFPQGRPRVAALAAWSAVGSVGGAAGSVLGGVLTDSWSWRWVLLINVPVGIFILLLGRYVLPPTVAGSRQRLDVPGAISATVGLAALTYAISSGPDHGWNSWQALSASSLAVMGLGWFLLLQLSRTRTRLLPLEMFRVRSFAWGNALMLLTGSVVLPLWYFVSIYLQEVAGYSAIEAGLAFLPHTLAMILGARLSPVLLPRLGPRVLTVIGAGAACVGFLWHAQVTVTSPLLYGVLLPGIIICLGLSLTFTSLAMVATAGLDSDDTGLASGVLNTSRQVGGAIGLAALSSLAVMMMPGNFGNVDQVSGFAAAFFVSAAVCVLIGLGALFLPEGEKSAMSSRLDTTAGSDSDQGNSRSFPRNS